MKRKKELNRIDLMSYGLSVRSNILTRTDNSIAIVIDRKSRIIMKDYNRILHIVDTIQQKDGKRSFVVATSAPVCSKTTKALKEKNITIIGLSEI